MAVSSFQKAANSQWIPTDYIIKEHPSYQNLPPYNNLNKTPFLFGWTLLPEILLEFQSSKIFIHYVMFKK